MFENCPDEFFNDCLNAHIYCKYCAAGEGKSNKLYYCPNKFNKKDHPYNKIKKDKQRQSNKQHKKDISTRSKRTKNALKKEKSVQDKIIKGTLKSGAIFGDGDYSLLEDQFHADHKYKSTQKGFSITAAEYEKGLKQDVTIWAVTNKDDETCFILTEETFYNLLALAKSNSKEEKE